MVSAQANKIAFGAAKSIIEAAAPLEIEIEGTPVQVRAELRPGHAWPRLAGGQALVGIDEAAEGPWPAAAALLCSWSGGAAELQLRLTIWRQRGPYEGHLALQIVTIPSNREIVWINLTKRVDDALSAREPRCAIPANFSLWARTGKRSARPLTDALTRAAAKAGLRALAATQFHALDILLPSGQVSPPPAEVFQRLVKMALLKLPFVTRGEEGEIQGTPPFDIRAARREAAEIPEVHDVAVPSVAAAEPAAPPEPPSAAPRVLPEPPGAAPPPPLPEASVSSQDNLFFDFIGVKDFGPFHSFEWNEMSMINVLVGENDTGKSHVLKLMYALARAVEDFTSRSMPDSDRPTWGKVLAEKLVWTFEPLDGMLGLLVRRAGDEPTRLDALAILCNEEYPFSLQRGASSDPRDLGEVASAIRPQPDLHALFLPPKEVLTSLNAVALVRERRMFGFDDTYSDLASALRLEPIQGVLPEELQRVLDDLDRLLGGRIVTEQGRFFFVRGAERFGMSQTAEGIKKIGILARLLQNGELRRKSILFLDEPEVNLHPKAARALVRMLFDLSRAGVQIFVATHSYFVLKEIEILARSPEQNEPVMLCSLGRDPSERSRVVASFADLRKGLPETGIGREALAQYDEDVETSWHEGT